jgi:hypothetical protein
MILIINNKSGTAASHAVPVQLARRSEVLGIIHIHPCVYCSMIKVMAMSQSKPSRPVWCLVLYPVSAEIEGFVPWLPKHTQSQSALLYRCALLRNTQYGLYRYALGNFPTALLLLRAVCA